MLIRSLFKSYSGEVNIHLRDWGLGEIIDSFSEEPNAEVQQEFICKSFIVDDSSIRCALTLAAIYIEAGKRREISKQFYEKLLDTILNGNSDEVVKGIH
jgi:hypothetical protein